MALPSSLIGLFLFIVLLWPGFVYSAIRGRTQPERPVSTLREAATITSASLIALVIVLGFFGLLRVLLPGHTPAIGALIADPQPYVRRHYVSLTWWIVGLTALAVGGAASTAWVRSASWLERLPFGELVAERPHPSQMSSWWLAFTEYPADEYDIHVGCALEDGSYVTGVLYAYPQSALDGPDRDLVLRAPIGFRAAGTDSVVKLEEAGLMTLSARRIITMTVGYVPVNAPQAVTPAPSPVSAQAALAANHKPPSP